MNAKKTIFVATLVGIAVVVYLFVSKRFEMRGHSIEPISKWKSILIGGWKYEHTDENERRLWLQEGEMLFQNSTDFSLIVTVKLFSKSNRDEPNAIYAGVIRGNWQFISDSTIELEPTSCKITKNFSDHYARNSFAGCEYFTGLKLGEVNHNLTVSHIEQFSKNKVSFRGHDYNQDSEVETSFTKEN